MSDSTNQQLNLFSANPLSKTPKNKLPEAIPVSVPKAIVQISPPDKAVPLALQPSVQEPKGPYLSDTAVAQRYAVSRPTIWRWTKSLANFPQPAKLSPGTTRWRLIDLQAFDRIHFEQMEHPVTRSKK
jgi:prophage regulatory protein